MDSLKLFRSAHIYTPVDNGKALKGAALSDIKVYDNGAVLVRNGYIEAAGPYDDVIKSLKDETPDHVYDCEGRCVIPGFVDPHTHGCFLGLREDEFMMRLNHASYLEIHRMGGGIRRTVSKVRNASEDELAEATCCIADKALKSGTTSIEIKSGYGLTPEHEVKILRAISKASTMTPADIVPTFLGAHTIPEEYSGREDAYVDVVINDMLPAVAEKKLAKFCDIAVDEGFFSIKNGEKVLTAAKKLGLGIKMHADELSNFGAAKLAAKLKVTSADHLLRADTSGLQALAESEVIACLLPATAFSLKEPYAPARKMIEMGVPVALATDCNPGSCYCESMEFVFQLAVLGMDLSVNEALSAATLNSAYAIGINKSTGSIEAGKKADFLILDGETPAIIPYHLGHKSVKHVFKAGERII